MHRHHASDLAVLLGAVVLPLGVGGTLSLAAVIVTRKDADK